MNRYFMVFLIIVNLINNNCFSQIDTIKIDSINKYQKIIYGTRSSAMYKDSLCIVYVNYNSNGDTSDFIRYYYKNANIIAHKQYYTENKILWNDCWEINDIPFGTDKVWYEDGSLQSIGNYVLNCLGDTTTPKKYVSKHIKDGKWIYWNNKGYLNKIEYYDCGKKIYLWKYWNERGVLIKEEEYKDDVLIKTTDF